MSKEQELKDLQAQLAVEQSKKARAEIERENAKEAQESTKKKLLEEFGVSTGEEIKTLLAKLSSALDDKVEEAKRGLSASL